jgi:DNA-binding transcriptional ArsR family regulator
MTSTAARAEQVFRAISDPTRRAILDTLGRQGERTVGQLLAPFPFSQPAMSKHLRVLRDAGLVSDRKVGRERLYQVEARALKSVADWVRYYERFWARKMDRLGILLDEMP